MPRIGWTTVAVSKDTVDAIKEVAPYANVSSFAREAIEEKLQKLTLVSTGKPGEKTAPTKLTTISSRAKRCK